MGTFHPEVGGRAPSEIEPLAVAPRQAYRLLSVGHTKLYELIASAEIESYQDGRSRRITMASIRSRIARLLANSGVSATSPAHNAVPRQRRQKS
jgi:excisionase family DNA binding protein